MKVINKMTRSEEKRKKKKRDVKNESVSEKRDVITKEKEDAEKRDGK